MGLLMNIISGSILLGYSILINPAVPEPVPLIKYPVFQSEEQEADLRVTELSMVSVTPSPGRNEIRIQVLIQVKNTGTAACGPFQINGFYQQGAEKQETKCRESIKVQGLAPGATFVKVFIFSEPESAISTPYFFFRIKADAENRLREKSRQNNYSDWLRLSKPAS